MIDLDVEIKVPDVHGEKIKQGFSDGIKDATSFLNQKAVENAPRKHGTLRRSITSEVSELSGKVIQRSSVAPYGMYAHDGTGIYGNHHSPIVPKSKKVLKFKIGNTIFYRRSVKGQEGKFYMKKASEEGKDGVKERVIRAIKKALGVS